MGHDKVNEKETSGRYIVFNCTKFKINIRIILNSVAFVCCGLENAMPQAKINEFSYS